MTSAISDLEVYATSRRGIATAVVLWATSVTALTGLMTERIAAPLRANSVAIAVARITAYGAAASTVVLTAAGIASLGLVIWCGLRWFRVQADCRQTVFATLGAFWVLSLQAVVGLLVTMIVAAPPPDVHRFPTWNAYLHAAQLQEPFRTIAALRYPALAVMCGVIVIQVRRRTGCRLIDATLATGIGVATLGAVSMTMGYLVQSH